MPPGRGGGNAKVVHPGITEIFTKFNCNYCQVGVRILYNILPYNVINVVSQDSYYISILKKRVYFFSTKICRNMAKRTEISLNMHLDNNQRRYFKLHTVKNLVHVGSKTFMSF